MRKLSPFEWWFLSWTWGFTMTLTGFIVAGICLFCGIRPHRVAYGYQFRFGKNWGGFNLGPVSLTSTNASEYLHYHEFGHSIQNCYFGPFTWFIVTLPSVIRYWYRIIIVNWLKKPQNELPDYYDIWFERSASELGALYAPLN